MPGKAFPTSPLASEPSLPFPVPLPSSYSPWAAPGRSLSLNEQQGNQGLELVWSVALALWREGSPPSHAPAH